MIEFFHSPGSRTIKAFNEAVSSELLPNIQMTPAYKDNRPKKADMVLVSGDGPASKAVERYAWRLGAYPCYVPECSEWLTHKIRQAMQDGTDLVMVDASLAATNQYSGAR